MSIGGLIDILMVQEHHLNERRCASYGSILQGNWCTYWLVGIGDHGSNAGICISINSHWQEGILYYSKLDGSMYMHQIMCQKGLSFGLSYMMR